MLGIEKKVSLIEQVAKNSQNDPAWLGMKDWHHFDLLEEWHEGDPNKEICTLKIRLRNIIAILQMSQNINNLCRIVLKVYPPSSHCLCMYVQGTTPAWTVSWTLKSWGWSPRRSDTWCGWPRPTWTLPSCSDRGWLFLITRVPKISQDLPIFAFTWCCWGQFHRYW